MDKPGPDTDTLPDALMLMGTRCPYCPSVLKALQSLQKTGDIGHLETHNIEENPHIAQKLGVRSVPWVRIGPFELEGLRSEKELREWAVKAATNDGHTDWLAELLSSGNISKPLEHVKSDPSAMNALLKLFAAPDTELNTQIGISAIMEDLQGTDTLSAIVEQLGKLTQHEDARVRGDACHYLALSGNPDTAAYIKPLLHDNDANVRDIARESLDVL
jgi:thioredoxin-like negative regulator of GroEL